jgi:hypothetical protein
MSTTIPDRKRDARIAGALYLAMILTGAVGLVYVPMRIVDGGPMAITGNLVAHADLVRAGILAAIVCQVTFLFLGRALGRLFAGVDDKTARLLMTIITAAAPIAIVVELFHLAALQLAQSPTQQELALTMFALRQQGVAIAGFFWGLWLFPFGLLVIRSGFIPKLLGIFLIAGGTAYLADSTLALFAPAVRAEVTAYLLVPLAIGELAMVLWLLIAPRIRRTRTAFDVDGTRGGMSHGDGSQLGIRAVDTDGDRVV